MKIKTSTTLLWSVEFAERYHAPTAITLKVAADTFDEAILVATAELSKSKGNALLVCAVRCIGDVVTGPLA